MPRLRLPLPRRPALAILLVVAAAPAVHAQGGDPGPRREIRSIAFPRPGFVVTSSDVDGRGTLSARQEANGFGCAGRNESPQLAWRGAPPGTRSFAVTMFDLDAPTGSGFWHWIVHDIPASATSIRADAGRPGRNGLPSGAVQARTDFGVPGYGGVCPPSGDGAHRYLITVHALGVDHLDAPADATPAVIGFLLHGHTLATATLTVRYARPAAASSGSSVAP